MSHEIDFMAVDWVGARSQLTGNKQGAIDYFQAFVDSPNISQEYKTQRQQWIEALKKGENPFTDEVLEELKNQ